MLNFNQEGSGKKPELRINPSDLPWIGCKNGTQIYESGFLFKRLSPLLSPTGKEEHVPAEVVICKTCNKVPKFVWSKIPDFPVELKADCE